MNTKNNTQDAATQEREQPDAASLVNILIVDDEPKNLTVLESVLDDPGYRLVRASSGEEALLALVQEEFAVLVLDVRMPGMSGFEVAQLVKERRKTARIPIIFLTAYYNEDEHILEGYGSGAVDYLHKPVKPAVLRSKVAVFAELHRKGRELAAANRLLLGEVAERRNAEARLSELNASLDRRVMERTTELRASEERLLEEHRRKDGFLATLAHELRNPLAPVRSAVELIKRNRLDANKLQWASSIIDRQVRLLSRLIDDLMDVSRINRGRIELRRELMPLNEALIDALDAIRSSAKEAGLELAVLLPDTKLLVDGDRTRLAQAFTNLLVNAVKYTEPGGRIELVVAVERENVIVTVRDTGIGIPADRLETIFEMFSQVESALARSRGGLGIGLSLTQQLIRLHGGSVKAQSEGPGLGSRFLVQLPLASSGTEQAPSLPPSHTPSTSSTKLSILVADDNEDAASSLTQLLELLGHEVRQVHDGEAAVRAVQEFGPSLVLLDIGMPGLNGHDAARLIRQQPGGSGRTLVAVTGWGQPQDLRRSSDAGFDHHLVKPIEFDQLFLLIERVCSNAPATQADPAPTFYSSGK
ncbi:response regulator [Ramlibacter tataouinensis]|uniref:histidine kinase n=1 Tax=Ramlibacter tataouinensis (strain ATCC BAA-407 / DSM 14655 / LMG 21543 / TTB310) TaxID=365046 RepID=F5Y1R9_RAMTT|nr:response regulator [Ramlibacter tataouinensis]AEG92320.1 candidate histidine kinase, atypical hybrid [Ramlibacter tataouinensis TTB310]